MELTRQNIRALLVEHWKIVASFLAAIVFVVSSWIIAAHTTNTPVEAEVTGRLMTVHDRGAEQVFLTEAATVNEALETAGIDLDPRDTVEPSRDEELVASDYTVNIYRARPVVVVDGATRTKIMTPYQTADSIATDAGIKLYSEDIATITRSDDYVSDGAGLQLSIDRAVPIVLDLYGRTTNIRTQGNTVADMLQKMGIELGEKARVSVALNTAITAGMNVRVWREGKQTVSVDEPIAYETTLVYDADRPLGYKATKTDGKDGVRTITYEVEIKDGDEISRTQIASIVTTQPTTRVEVLGIKGMGEGLTKAKGAIYHVDSKGVSHRETYYDLNMSVVMQACGQNGRYSVRVDGAKIDADGYVLVAANYARYPRCSVVETSMGPGKVYDTGGFVTHHPDGFDLATDWSAADGI